MTPWEIVIAQAPIPVAAQLRTVDEGDMVIECKTCGHPFPESMYYERKRSYGMSRSKECKKCEYIRSERNKKARTKR